MVAQEVGGHSPGAAPVASFLWPDLVCVSLDPASLLASAVLMPV